MEDGDMFGFMLDNFVIQFPMEYVWQREKDKLALKIISGEFEGSFEPSKKAPRASRVAILKGNPSYYGRLDSF